MEPHLVLRADVPMNPVSLAVHLAAFAEPGSPLSVAAGPLWEESERPYSMLSLVDTIGWPSDEPQSGGGGARS